MYLKTQENIGYTHLIFDIKKSYFKSVFLKNNEIHIRIFYATKVMNRVEIFSNCKWSVLYLGNYNIKSDTKQ